MCRRWVLRTARPLLPMDASILVPPVVTHRVAGIPVFRPMTKPRTYLWNWLVDSNPHEGGSVWSPISYDGTYLYFGTGNTCDGPMMTANGAAALTLDGTLAWSYVAARNSKVDDDTGGGVLIARNRAFFINKNGLFYGLGQNGAYQWDSALGAQGSGQDVRERRPRTAIQSSWAPAIRCCRRLSPQPSAVSERPPVRAGLSPQRRDRRKSSQPITTEICAGVSRRRIRYTVRWRSITASRSLRWITRC